MERVFSVHNKIAFFVMVFVSLQVNAFAAHVAVQKQSVDGGTKIMESGTNSLVDAECSDSYFGCMDAFCMVDNVSGGRCQCSNKHADLTKQLNDLLAKDEDAVTLAQYGADFVKMGGATETVLQDAEKAKQKTVKKPENKNTTLSRADWDAMFMTPDDEDEEEFVDADDISNKHGDALYIAADEMCWEQTPSKCKSSQDMVKMLYAQKIKSDCIAFENSVKQQSIEINSKLADAQKSVRDAALSAFANENKYNIGECMIELRTCMQTTAGCGNDYSKCVALSENENVKTLSKKVVIPGDFVNTEISATTMDTLLSKKVLCESVLNSCAKVKDDVWNAFLKDAAISLKTAELNSEENLRKNCTKTISDCYVKSCREHFDVNEEGGSYDMCLSRPENYKSFCKVELEPCLAATGGSYDNPSKSRLWNGIMAELSKMRIDACTTEFKACIQDKDRCGSDYSQCIGLDYYDIVDICPADKLTACYREYDGNKETVEDTLAILSQGLIMGVESELYDACQKAISAAMLKTCGDSESCDGLIIGDKVGANTLELKFCKNVNGEYTNCKDSIDDILENELGKMNRNADLSKTKTDRTAYTGVISGRILWDQITTLPDASGVISGDEYIKKVESVYKMDDKVKGKVKTEVGQISVAVKNAISAIESDPKVQFCMTGREVTGLTKDNGFEQIIGKANNQLFPHLTADLRNKIINSALLAAQKNYDDKYAQIVKDYVDGNSRLQQRYDEIDKINEHMNAQDVARRKCIELGEWGAISQDKVSGHTAKTEIVRDRGNDDRLVGYSSESTYKFKRQVTTTFNMDSMVCTKCTRTQECLTTKSDWCKKWDDEQEECEDIQY